MVELSLIFRARVVNRGTEKGTCRPPLGLSPSCLISATDSWSLAQNEVWLESQLKVQGAEVAEKGSGNALRTFIILCDLPRLCVSFFRAVHQVVD